MLSRTFKILPGLIVLILFIFPVMHLGAQTVDRIVAVVNGEIITLYELNQRVKPHVKQMQAQLEGSLNREKRDKLRAEVLESIVDEMLLSQEALRLQIKVSDSEVSNHIDQLKRKQGLSEKEFQKQLKNEGLTSSEYEKRIKDKIARHRLLGTMVRKKVVVTEAEIQKYYEENSDKYRQDKSVNVSLLLIESKSKAESLRKEIAQGKLSFDRAAKQYSIGPAAEQGGDLGQLKWKDLGSKWKEALQGVEPGKMSSVFFLQDNYAILYLNNRKEGTKKPLDEVRDQIHDLLYRPKLEQRYQEYMEQLRSKAVIDIRL